MTILFALQVAQIVGMVVLVRQLYETRPQHPFAQQRVFWIATGLCALEVLEWGLDRLRAR